MPAHSRSRTPRCRDSTVVVLAGSRPRGASMSLDPDAERVLDLIKAAGRPPIQVCSLEEARAGYRASRKVLTPDPPEVAQVQELAAPGPAGDIPLRLYRGIGAPEHAAPTLVFLHGGGFCIGDLDTHDVICRKLAND